MLLEEKRHMARPKRWQKDIFVMLWRMLAKCGDEHYRGFHFVQFENTNPDDGAVYWDKKKITRDELIGKLQFDTSPSTGDNATK